MADMAGTKGRSGRPATTSHQEIAEAAARLFEEKGYAATSVTDIAAAAGIARRTFFSYFASKSDAFWWENENDLRTVERALAASSPDAQPLQQVIDIAMAAPSWIPPTKESARARHLMIEDNPELQVGSQRFQRRWSRLIADHLRRRVGDTTSELVPEVIATALIGVAQAVLVRWATNDDERPLRQIFYENIDTVRRAFEETVAEQLLH